MTPLISVVVPVYNAEKYLRECLDSVVDQSLREIEIICVDDGSTDASPAILAEYAARDSRRIRRPRSACPRDHAGKPLRWSRAQRRHEDRPRRLSLVP